MNQKFYLEFGLTSKTDLDTNCLDVCTPEIVLLLFMQLQKHYRYNTYNNNV